MAPSYVGLRAFVSAPRSLDRRTRPPPSRHFDPTCSQRPRTFRATKRSTPTDRIFTETFITEGVQPTNYKLGPRNERRHRVISKERTRGRNLPRHFTTRLVPRRNVPKTLISLERKIFIQPWPRSNCVHDIVTSERREGGRVMNNRPVRRAITRVRLRSHFVVHGTVNVACD